TRQRHVAKCAGNRAVGRGFAIANFQQFGIRVPVEIRYAVEIEGHIRKVDHLALGIALDAFGQARIGTVRKSRLRWIARDPDFRACPVSPRQSNASNTRVGPSEAERAESGVDQRVAHRANLSLPEALRPPGLRGL